MPTSMTYTGLLEQLRRYIERGQSVDTQVYTELPYLINNTERDLAQKFQILGTREVVTDTMVAGTSVYLKPDRWRSTEYINFGVGVSPTQERRSMFPRSYDYLRSYWPNSELEDEPQFYADYNQQNWLFAPTPDDDYPYEVNYWQLIPLLDVANQTNFWTDYCPLVLLYGTLMYCAPFLKNDDRVQTWGNFYKDQIATISAQDLMRIADNVNRKDV